MGSNAQPQLLLLFSSWKWKYRWLHMEEFSAARTSAQQASAVSANPSVHAASPHLRFPISRSGISPSSATSAGAGLV